MTLNALVTTENKKYFNYEIQRENSTKNHLLHDFYLIQCTMLTIKKDMTLDL